METKTIANKTKWAIDPTHSEILFKVRHMMIANVKGEFTKFQADISADADDFRNASVSVSIDASSVFTKDETRDNHLRSADFFDVATHPTLSFEGIAFAKGSNGNFELEGTLTIKGVSKPLALNVEFGGVNKDPWGNERVGFTVTGTINRKDFGLNWNAALETGGVLVSDEVKILAEAQFVKQK
ncbi:MAG TPA: YceI family protein [Chryseosolibacter sp.]|jgi:polyisoprenoid-binding protein YceI|nr:YceI family protein [Chryseosolibacter sp.]